MSSKVALIDDDVVLTGLLKDFIQAEGFSVDIANDGQEGLDLVRQGKPDIVVLDIMMPKLNGIEVLKRIRSESLTPVIMLTARGDDADCVMGLELGADDYVTKPCTPHELTARIRAILRRMGAKEPIKNAASSIITAGPLKLYTALRRIERDGVAIQLTSTEFNLLELLILKAGQIVTKETLSKEGVGRPLKPFDRIIDVHISSIRNKIGRLPDGRSLIKTVIRRGYQLIVE
jgi:two-component system, OmpR family, response regulator